MRKWPITRLLLLLLVTAIGLGGCAGSAPPAAPAETEAAPINTLEVEIVDFSHETENGVQYCINSASLRFIPYDETEAEGYGYLMDIFE